MKKLNILIITQAIWYPRFGAVKVHIDLKEEYERQGHQVDKLSLEDLYPKGQNLFSKIFGKLYTENIFDFLKKNAHKYDVIDANFSCVTHPKNSFGFRGLVLFRSHGIGPIYESAEQNIERYKQALESIQKKPKIKTRIGNIYRALQKKAGPKEFDLSVKYADLVHCLNDAEYQYFKENGVAENKLLPLPNGIPDGFIYNMNLSSTTHRENSVCFIGAWSVRKGSRDIDEIISLIEENIKIKEIVLLGGQSPKKAIENAFSDKNKSKLSIIPDFNKSELLSYVNHCRVGLFPSYAEGHPLAIIEQLAMGIPVVAYNVPGSSDILNKVDNSLLILPGDIKGFANKVTEILKLDGKSYDVLVKKCKLASRDFLLSTVTERFTSKYNNLLSENKNVPKLFS